MPGVVYFIQEGRTGPIKIGWTSNCPHRRRDNLQIGNSEDLHLLGVLPDVDQSVEAEWHNRFSEFRKRSEWFWPSESLVRAIGEQFPAPERKSIARFVRANDEPNELASLKNWLRTNGLRQGDVADWLCVSQAHVSKVMRGLSPLSVDHAKTIEAYTCGAVRAHDLLGLEVA